ncbi:YggS family pyridoxal phosphate-dependent enzyme [Portibacter lacus]|uniref:Pyridoxal phosphate homeostasis protein n=1 Tax=Portibacter lacus TaxID=1099794 RepID=A0AA37WE33_9BACT|nr:YggS family pyridoxal phosphate-dependent enzyme [Portibacter lacus]GLR16244.1 YggS family pyridoxal phosphate enzyme [Portibacter lacus]
MDYFKELSQLKATLVAVSKTKPESAIEDLYHKGQRIFGENRVTELVEKHKHLPKDIEWHFIGHLQSKKTKDIAPFVHMIESADSFKLLGIIDQEAAKNNRKINVLLQLKIAKEETKYGFEFDDLVKHLDVQKYPNLNFKGVMGMATFTEDTDQVRNEFKNLVLYNNEIKATHFKNDPGFNEISMGMSGDYKIAIEEGSTMIRIGSLLFGAR